MTTAAAPNQLERSGSLSEHSLPELLVEISQAMFDGSLRLGREGRKAILYFRCGHVVHAATNSKTLRLFHLLLQNQLITPAIVSRFPNFANDVEFARYLTASGAVSQGSIDEATREQVRQTLEDALAWTEGGWTFSPLVRARDDISCDIDVAEMMVRHARETDKLRLAAAFKNPAETFAMAPPPEELPALQMHESFVLAHFGSDPLSLADLRTLCQMPDDGLLQALYTLWIAGLIVRRDWNSAFDAEAVDNILAARVEKAKRPEPVAVRLPERPAPQEDAEEPAEQKEEQKPETESPPMTIEEYLDQVENGVGHYGILGIDDTADNDVVKAAYFALAKQFHPDRFHREAPATLKRIQSAFTAVAHAYEVLRSPQSRAAYTDKYRAEVATRAKRAAEGKSETAADPTERNAELGLENFEEGMRYLAAEEFEQAAACFGRSVVYSPNNALFQAHLGKALSFTDDRYRHKAETAFQTAVRLDPSNFKIRRMLVEFYVDYDMHKRAEGELTRYLSLVPDDKEAQAMLDKVKSV